jgi:amidase
VEVAAEALQRIHDLNPVLRAFLLIDDDTTMAQARASEAAYRRNEFGPLEGLPVSVKDVFHVRGWPTTLGSLLHVDDVARQDSGVVARLRAAGAVFTGKTNTAEFGQSATTDNLLGDDTVNPWDRRRTAGGSSGGAAASVAAGLSSIAIGSDGGGSVRIPAAFCGLVGFKPTFGTCHDELGFKSMSAFSCPGPLAWRSADVRSVLEVMAETPCEQPSRRTLRVGVCPQPERRPVDRRVLEHLSPALGVIERLGHEVVEIDLPVAGWVEVFGVLVDAEEGRERGDLLAQPGSLTRYVRRTLEAARQLTPADIERAEAELTAIRGRMLRLFSTSVDVVITPTTAVPAFPLQQRPRVIADQPVTTRWGAFPFTAPFNLTGGPAVTVPCGLAEGLPVGLQLASDRGSDWLLLDLAEALQDQLEFDATTVLDSWVRSNDPPSPPSAFGLDHDR